MARMDHVTQIGKPQEAPGLYLEDYAYTYLKRQKDTNQKKFYLYGEREGGQELEKWYIYGISDSPKEESTYFKDYYPLGFLKIRDGERILVNRRGQEKTLTGFYVFYAPNQSMQEYLVDTNLGDKEEDRLRKKPSKEIREKNFYIREKFVLAGKRKPALSERLYKKSQKKVELGNLVFYAGCILALFLLAVAVTGGNGYHKLSALRQMVLQTMSTQTVEESGEEFVVEEQRIDQDIYQQQTVLENDLPQPSEETPPGESVSETGMEETQPDMPNTKEPVPSEAPASEAAVQTEPASDEEYETYIVQEGDTLAKICKVRYGSTGRMKEICDYNEIKNEDYIAPGQKLYLPK